MEQYPEGGQYPLFLYGGEPPSVGVDTSQEAASRVEANNLARLVLRFIRHRGDEGATCDEIEVETGLRHQTASARCRELELAGRIDKTPTKRPTRSGRAARVYRVSEATGGSNASL